MLRSDFSRLLSHLFPDDQRRGIHVEQADLAAIGSPLGIDADCGQETHLVALNQESGHANGRSILDVLQFTRILCDDSIVRRVADRVRGVFG